MKLLGTLGFDWKIFLIQALNFLILFFILKKIFFKPFVQALQKEKLQSKKLKTSKKVIVEEKKKWEEEKRMEIKKMQEKIKLILAETEKSNKNIFDHNEAELINKEQKALKKIKRQSQAIADEYKERMVKNYQTNLNEKFTLFFQEQLSAKINLTIQDSFWKEFLKKINLLKIDKSLLTTEKEGRQLTLSIVSAFPLKKNQLRELKKIIRTKTNIKKIILEEEEQPSLIAGFSLIIGGLLVEKNLKQALQKLIL